MRTEVKNEGLGLFYKYLDKYKDQVKNESSENYYHVNVVSEAYNQGALDGKKSSEKDFVKRILKSKIEKIIQKSNQIYILSQNLISFLKEEGFNIKSLHINLSPDQPKVILSVLNEILIDDNFVEKAYSKIFEVKEIYLSLFNSVLDVGFVGADNLDKSLLLEDDFGYVEEYD